MCLTLCITLLYALHFYQVLDKNVHTKWEFIFKLNAGLIKLALSFDTHSERVLYKIKLVLWGS